LIARLRFAFALRRSEGLANLSFADADSARILLSVTELGNLNRRQRDADQIVALLSDHFPAADVLRKVALHLAADDLPEALQIAFNFLSHDSSPR
jgi:hypothetical protein